MFLVRSERPGPVDGGEPRGNIWAPDYRAYENFKTIGDLEALFNRALVKDGSKFQFPSDRLPFCHIDLARRNILLLEDQSFVLLDWADAGFYPITIQIWNLNAETEDLLFVDTMLEKLPELVQTKNLP